MRGIQYGPAFAGLAAAHTAEGDGDTVLAEVAAAQFDPLTAARLRGASGAAGRLLPVGGGPPSVRRAGGGLLLPLGVRRLRAYGPARQRPVLPTRR